MKKIKTKIIALLFLFSIAVFAPSCDIILEALNEPTNQVDDNTKDPKDADANGNTSKGKTGGGIYIY